MSMDDWIPCTGIKQGYFSSSNFFTWLQEHLIPAVNQHGDGRPMVIVMDNVSIHVKDEVTEYIQGQGHAIRYLPPYSPDFNPIELTFSVLKAWMKRNWIFHRRICSSYGDFLSLSIRNSHCGRFAKEQFNHAGGVGVYIEAKKLDEFQRYLRQYEAEEAGEADANIYTDQVGVMKPPPSIAPPS